MLTVTISTSMVCLLSRLALFAGKVGRSILFRHMGLAMLTTVMTAATLQQFTPGSDVDNLMNRHIKERERKQTGSVSTSASALPAVGRSSADDATCATNGWMMPHSFRNGLECNAFTLHCTTTVLPGLELNQMMMHEVHCASPILVFPSFSRLQP